MKPNITFTERSGAKRIKSTRKVGSGIQNGANITEIYDYDKVYGAVATINYRTRRLNKLSAPDRRYARARARITLPSLNGWGDNTDAEGTP